LQKTATSVAAAAAQNSNQRLLEAGRGHGSRALTDAGSDPASSDTSETDLVLADADLQTTAAAAGDAALGAVLSRQGSSIMLQPSSSCSFQFLVTRNPTLLQADPQAAARAESAVGASRRHSSSSSWWVSLGALFAGVSAVLALVICYMSAQLWARYKVSTGPDRGLLGRYETHGGPDMQLWSPWDAMRDKDAVHALDCCIKRPCFYDCLPARN
jgi:hypothetical protein